MRACDVILLPRKGPGKDDLAEIRRSILQTHAPDTAIVEFQMPVRDAKTDYASAVEDWHDQIALAWRDALPDNIDHVGLLVWGDPSLYDSTLRIAARFDPVPETDVVPGITSLQVLTAAHAIPLNDVNAPVLITTGRNIRDHGWPNGADRVAVMLDGECSFQNLDPKGLFIWWGAFLGMTNQLLMSGPLTDLGPQIVKQRAQARSSHGWIMDTYLLARVPD